MNELFRAINMHIVTVNHPRVIATVSYNLIKSNETKLKTKLSHDV